MARDNDMGGGSLVPLALSSQHIPILRERLTTWLDGVRGDLEALDEAQRPDQAWQEARAFERLLTALATGKLRLPDEAARTTIEVSAAASDEESDYVKVAATHDALHALLDALGGGES